MAVVLRETSIFPTLPVPLRQAGGGLAGTQSAVARFAAALAQFKAPDGAVRRGFIEQVQVAEVDEVGDRSGLVNQPVERDGRGGLEQVARGDEDQLAARR